MSYPIKSPRKLIEVALPLDAINVACSREKSIRHGHPSTLHLWWARRPLAAARAVIFAQLVNDPGYQQDGGFKYGKNKKEAALERKRLFKIMEDLVLWENTTNEDVLERARAEIRRSWREVCDLNKDHPQAAELFNPEKLPAFHDPFAGGGAIPLEAQRLGMEAFASDLNPVAVLINKAMIDMPSRFAGRPPVGPETEDPRKGKGLALSQNWPSARGLAEDVRRYGAWMRTEAKRRIGTLYPPVDITREMAVAQPSLLPLVGKQLTVIAWIWARTVKSPNPAFSHVDVPLASTFILCSKAGKEAYVLPVVEGDRYSFVVRTVSETAFDRQEFDVAAKGTKTGKAQDFFCLLSGSPISREDIRDLGKAQKLGTCLLAIVADGPKGRVYLAPTHADEVLARSIERNPRIAEARETFLSGSTPTRAMITGGVCSAYGLATWGHLFTSRQLLALTTFCDLMDEVRAKVREDTLAALQLPEGDGLEGGGSGATAYAEAVSVYLAFALSRLVNRCATTLVWNRIGEKIEQVFARQAIPMTWDFPEVNVFSDSTGGWSGSLEWIPVVLENLSVGLPSHAAQGDAQTQEISQDKFISTDPPYYDNISYAELSDFFYVWLRQALRPVYPNLLATITVPKAEELIATGYRHGGREKGEKFFLEGMTRALSNLARRCHPSAPITIYYAFKQSETHSTAGTSSPGWETFLEALHTSGLQLSGTWPMRTERDFGVKTGSNVLASSIILVCRHRPYDAPVISRRDFQRELNAVLPEALDEMTKGADGDRSPVAPVDLSQAIIGPGMAVFSKYTAVLEADGKHMSVRTALQLINRFFAEDDFDPDTRFCLRWFEQNGWKEGRFGDADTLSRATGTSVDGVKEAGVVASGGGLVRLLKWPEYATDWDPKSGARHPVWESLHHLIRALKQEGETDAGRLLAAVRGQGESLRQLAYRLYTLCERQGWAEDARAYNELITSWTGIESAAGAASVAKQGNLFEGN